MIPGDLCCSQFVLVLRQTTEKHLLVIAVLSPAVFVFVNMNIWKKMRSYVVSALNVALTTSPC